MTTENIISKGFQNIVLKSKLLGKTNEETETNDEKENKDEKPSYFWFAFNTLIFAYNSYVIANNLSVNDGYLFVLISLIVNVAIGVFYKEQFSSLFPKLNKNIAYAILGVAFIVGLSSGVGSSGSVLEETSIGLVTQIVQEQYSTDAVCKAVRIDEEVSDGFYKATAILDSGVDLNITIEEKANNMIYVQIPYQ